MYYVEKSGDKITGKGTAPNDAVLNEGQFEVTKEEYDSIILPRPPEPPKPPSAEERLEALELAMLDILSI